LNDQQLENSGANESLRQDSGFNGNLLNSSRSKNEHSSSCVIRVGEMFAGIGGFRKGLEMANERISERGNSTNLESKQSRQQPNNSRELLQGKRAERVQGSTNTEGKQTWTSGFRIVWANEIDKYASQIYRKNFGEQELQQGDVRDINTDKIPDIDLLCGGFPCQSFSVAGKRKGTEEYRGTLFAQIVRVASAKRPQLLLLENVKGLLSSDDGRDFAKILRALGNMGYLLEWQVLNSKYFGVPQNRERVFIVGHLGDGSGSQIFPIRQTISKPQEWDARKQVANTLQSPGHACGNYKGMNMIYWANSKDKWSKREVTESTPALKSQNDLCRQPLLLQIKRTRADGNHTVREYEIDSPTLTQQMGTGGNNVPLLAGQQIRRLTPTECEKLQGFPIGWTIGVSDTQRYKTIGNAVTVNVIEYLGRLILEAIA
jgi:DNA (cytosine-5)-methyltransferase 1